MVDELPIGKGAFSPGQRQRSAQRDRRRLAAEHDSLSATGPYATPFMQFDSSGNANNGFNRPDLAGNPNNFHHTRTQWWNPNVFACPGGAPGQDFIPGNGGLLDCYERHWPLWQRRGRVAGRPRNMNFSLGLAKDFQLTERFKLKFESSFTNLPNHPNFDDPRQNLSESTRHVPSGTFGRVLASRAR